MAIAFDASNSSIVNPSISLTFSHTCGGSNRILFVGVQTGSDSGALDITVKYAGVSMTLLSSQDLGGTNDHLSLWYLVAPSTGANNIVVSKTHSGFIGAFSASYTGAAQSGIPDAHTENTAGNSSLATSVTSVADNCWFIYIATDSSGNFSSLSNGTIRAPTSSSRFIADSNSAKTPAGSYTMTYNAPALTTIWANMASFAPAHIPTTYTETYTETLTPADTLAKATTKNLVEAIAVTPGNTIDTYTRVNGTSLTGFQVRSGQWACQSFTSTNTNVLASASAYLLKSGSPTGNVFAQLYAHSGTYGTNSVATGTALATSDLIPTTTITQTGSNSVASNYSLYTFTFSGANQITLNAATHYVIAFTGDGGDGSNFCQARVIINGTHPGNFIQNLTTPSQFYDLNFTVSSIDDGISFSLTRPLTETITTTVTFLKSISRSFIESITSSDTFAGARVIASILTETVTVTDSFLRSISRTFSETITATASAVTTRLFARIYTEALTVTDAFSKSFSRVFAEPLSLIATVRNKLNGSDVLWSRVLRSSNAVWTKISRASDSTWTRITRNSASWTHLDRN